RGPRVRGPAAAEGPVPQPERLLVHLEPVAGPRARGEPGKDTVLHPKSAIGPAQPAIVAHGASVERQRQPAEALGLQRLAGAGLEDQRVTSVLGLRRLRHAPDLAK